MKDIVYESHFQKILFSKEDFIFEIEWKNTKELEDEIYREEVENQLETFEQHQGRGLLIDTSNFVFGIVPETQEWAAENVFPRAQKAGITHTAVLVSSDFIAQLSIEQNMDEDVNPLISQKLFDDKEQARDWLKENM